MELREALDQISEIRSQMARTQVFRGYRSITTASTALIAFIAAGIQQWLIPQPQHHAHTYLAIWGAAAIVSIFIVICELIFWCRRSASAMQNQITFMTVEQLIPSLVAGAMLTLVIAQFAWQNVWMLPGLWAIVFALGVFASRRLLPRGTAGVGAFYMFAGLFMLTRGGSALSAWYMGVTFGVGQLLAAMVLYWNLERHHGEQHHGRQ